MEKFFLQDHKGRKWQIGEVKDQKITGKTKNTADFKVKIDGNETDFFLASLIMYATGEHSKELKEHAGETLDFIAQNLSFLQVKIQKRPGGQKGEAGFNWEGKNGQIVSKEEIKQAFNNPAAISVFSFIVSNPGAFFRPKEVQKGGGILQMSQIMHSNRIAEKERKGAAVKYLKPKIQLTPDERKFERALLSLLWKKSDLNRESPDYYTGNGPSETAIAEIFEEEKRRDTAALRQAVIICRWPELYREYTGKHSHQISGKERQIARKLLGRFQEILVSIIWEQEIPNSKKVRVFRLEEPLVKQGSTADLTPGELAAVEAGGEMPEEKETLYLLLHPAYIENIKNRSVKEPIDYNKRLSFAIGKGKKETTHGLRLRDYLNAVRCGGKQKTEIGFAAAVGYAGLDRMLKKQGAKATKGAILREIEISKRVGLIDDYKEEQTVKGEVKFVIQFNPDFAK